MCEPATIMTAITVASTIYGAFSQYQNASAQAEAAKKQQEYQQRNWQLEAKANADAAQRHIDQLTIARGQTRAKFLQEKTAAQREQRARSARIVAEGETALNTGLMASLLGESAFQYAEDVDAIAANEGAEMQQLQYEQKEARHRGTTVGLGPTGIIAKPSLAHAIIGGGLGVAGNIAGHYDKKTPEKKK